MKKYNLVVVGGGFAGVAAAISAARAGLEVLLVEKGNSLGGAAVNNLVNPFMKNSTYIEINGKKELFEFSQGIYSEIRERLAKVGAIDKDGFVFHEEYLKLILNRMVLEANAELLFHTRLIDATMDDNKVTVIKFANKAGQFDCYADYYIDTTGDGDLAYFCGLPYKLGREEDGLCQPMTLCFRLGNVDMKKFESARSTINPKYQELQAQGKIKNVRENVLIFKNLSKGVLHFNSTRIVKRNPVDAFDVTKAEIEAREQVFELYDFLKKNIDGFQNADLLMTAAEIGVRESRMFIGEYVLTGKDLVDCVKFEDSIALGNYDIDIHNPEGSGTSLYRFPEGKYYTIPYRSLIPKGSKNLLIAGRCISATHEAQASIRVMPIVCCLGQAAGTAVSIANQTKSNVGDINISVLQETLKRQGAVL